MKLLLDECMPVDFRLLLTGHDVFTVKYMGWSGIKNGALLARAADEAFDALVSTDGSLEHQQNLTTLPIAIVVLRAPSNKLPDLEPFVPALLHLLHNLPPRTVSRVP
jgi:uncharacterized protein DUF5615